MSQVNCILRVLMLTSLASSSLVLSGCKAVGDAFIPHHPASYVKDGCTTSLELVYPPSTNDVKLVAAAALTAAAAGIIVDQTAKAVTIESKKYDATFSARNSVFFIDTQGENIQSISIRRSQKCQVGTNEINKTLFLCQMGIRYERKLGVFRVVPEKVEISNTVSKVFAPGRCWFLKVLQWPADIIWVPWHWMDGSLNEVDFNARVVIEGVAWNEKKEGKTIVLCAQDFPLGKYQISDIGKGVSVPSEMCSKRSWWKFWGKDNEVTKKRSLQDVGSGYLPLVYPGQTLGKPDLPINVTVTITEGNDLGDIIGKGATELAKNKDSIVKQIVEAVGKK